MQVFIALVCIALLVSCCVVLTIRYFRGALPVSGRLRKWQHGTLAMAGLAGEAVVTVALLYATVSLFWMYFGIHQHQLPMTIGGFGRYGVVEDAQRLVPGTKILKFEALYVPSRILWFQMIPLRYFEWTAVPWPVPEAIQVHVEYRRPHHSPEEFDRTFLLSCSTKNRKECIALYQLIGIEVCGKGIDADGHGNECAYEYLRGQLLPQNGGAFTGPQKAPPLTAPQLPKPQPKRPPPRGVLIA